MKIFITACIPLVFLTNIFAAEKPNVLFILADDMGWADNELRDSQFYTPTISRLSQEGILLDNHYVQPQCTPTRVALLTGRYPGRFSIQANYAGSNQQVIPLDTQTLAKILQENGYQTGLFGKYHLSSRYQQGPQNIGFGYSYGSLAGGVGVYDHRYRLNTAYTNTWHRNGTLIPGAESGTPYTEGYHVTDLITADAIRFINQDHGGKPWFAYVAYTAVHDPLAEESKWFNDPAGRIATISDPDRRLMAAASYHLDSEISDLVDTLKATGQLHNTLIVFSSDNGGVTGSAGGSWPAPDPALSAGYSSNAPLRGGKSQSWDGGCRVVAFVYWPGVIPAGQVMTEPMHIVDWLPTICGLADIPLDPIALQLDGRDVWPQIMGQPYSSERDIYIAWGSTWSQLAFRRGDWKIRSGDGGSTWTLYNLATDPYETTDLSAGQSAKKTELINAYQAERAKDNEVKLISCWIDAPKTVSEGCSVSAAIAFSESVTGVTIDDLTITGATISNFSGSEGSYFVTVTPTVTAPATITLMVNVAAGTNGSRTSDRSPVALIDVVQTAGTSVGDLGLGVAFTDDQVSGGGTWYIMYSGTPVNTRFASNGGTHPLGASNLVGVRYDSDSSQWIYDSGIFPPPAQTEFPFTPVTTDRLLAELDFGTDVITALDSGLTTIHGINAGYAESNMQFFINQWNGSSNENEVYVTGTYFKLMPDTLSDTLTVELLIPYLYNKGPIPACVRFDEAVAGLELTDFTISGATLQNLKSLEFDHCFEIVPNGPGAIDITLNSSTVTGVSSGLANEIPVSGTVQYLPCDFEGSCGVDFGDYVFLAESWLKTGSHLIGDVIPNGKVDLSDLSLFVEMWLLYCR